MKKQITLDAVYAVSGEVVVRKIKDEMIIIPVSDEKTDIPPYFLNSTGQAIWRKLDGRRNLKAVIAALAAEFECPAKVIEKDVISLTDQLLKKKLIVKIVVE